MQCREGRRWGKERGKRNGQLRLFKASGTESPGTSAQKNGNGRLLSPGSIRLRDLTFIHRLAIQDFPEDVISGVLRIQIGMRRHPNSDRPKSGHGPVPGADPSRIIPVARRVTTNPLYGHGRQNLPHPISGSIPDGPSRRGTGRGASGTVYAKTLFPYMVTIRPRGAQPQPGDNCDLISSQAQRSHQKKSEGTICFHIHAHARTHSACSQRTHGRAGPAQHPSELASITTTLSF